MNYSEAISFIHSVEWRGSRPGLERIAELSEMLGHPERSFRAIHVAGTNGKGSFSAMLESVLRAAGFRTGLFTSPYLEFFEERICVGGVPISRGELAEIVTDIEPLCRRMSDPPTEFEILTAIGFEYFRRKKVEIAAVECGMGGRLDSTNILPPPLLSVITGVSLDHTAFLGSTVAAIAGEKAGIIKSGSPVLFGGKDKEAEEVIRSKAAELCSPFFRKDPGGLTEVCYSLSGSDFTYRGLSALHLALLGVYQPENAASVIEAVSILNRQGVAIPEEALRRGLASARWKGRFELMNRDPLVFFDGGHNEEGVSAAVRTVRLCLGGKRLILISGVMKDKDHAKIASELAAIAETVLTVTADNSRALDAAAYAEEFQALGVPASPCASFEEAVRRGYALAKQGDLPLLCVGSLYSYASFKASLTDLIHQNEQRR